MRRLLALFLLIAPTASPADVLPGTPEIPWRPRVYECPRAAGPVTIDGVIDGDEWSRAAWSGSFLDIRGGTHPAPIHDTRLRMQWDDDYLYVAAALEEPNVWGTLTERDAVIFHDNDFEVFIDPDGDTHGYYELEINALGTVWDLFLVRPYRDGGPALHEWDIPGLRTAVVVDGTLNDPSDTDRGWSVEIAFPWKALGSAANRDAPPKPGDVWRMNFSRVQWDTEVRDGAIVKRRGPDGDPLPERNWVWSPQGLINMHYPEMWGFVRFHGNTVASGRPHPADGEEERARWRLRTAYYAFKLGRPAPEGVTTAATRSGFEAWIDAGETRWIIDETGRVRSVSR